MSVNACSISTVSEGCGFSHEKFLIKKENQVFFFSKNSMMGRPLSNMHFGQSSSLHFQDM